MNPVQCILRNKALANGKAIDRASGTRGAKRKASKPRVDNTAPTMVLDPSTLEESVRRVPLHACGVVPVLQGKALGVIATPNSFRLWREAGKPAHPIYNPEAYRAERYRDNVLLPLGGISAVGAGVRHPTDCQCLICREFATRIQHVPDSRISPRDLGVAAPTARYRDIKVLAPPLRVCAS